MLIRSVFIWIYYITSQCHDQRNSGCKDNMVLHSEHLVRVAPQCPSQLPILGEDQQHRPLRLLFPEEVDKQSPNAKGKGRSRCCRSSMKIHLLRNTTVEKVQIYHKVTKTNRPNCTNKASIREVFLLTERNPLINPKQILTILRSSCPPKPSLIFWFQLLL